MRLPPTLAILYPGLPINSVWGSTVGVSTCSVSKTEGSKNQTAERGAAMTLSCTDAVVCDFARIPEAERVPHRDGCCARPLSGPNRCLLTHTRWKRHRVERVRGRGP